MTHIVQDIHPSLHGDALENSENSKEDIVKVGDPKAGSNPVLLAGGAIATGSCWWVQATREVCCLFTYSITQTSVHSQTLSNTHTSMFI